MAKYVLTGTITGYEEIDKKFFFRVKGDRGDERYNFWLPKIIIAGEVTFLCTRLDKPIEVSRGFYRIIKDLFSSKARATFSVEYDAKSKKCVLSAIA